MERRGSSIPGKEPELLSAEVQDIMGRIPPAIVRWGMTVMAVVVAGLLFGASLVKWPERSECRFEGEWDGSAFKVTAPLSPEMLRYVSSEKHCGVTLYSPMFTGIQSENGVSGTISSLSVESHAGDHYTAELTICVDGKDTGLEPNRRYMGSMCLLKSDRTLLELLLYRNRILNVPP